MRDLIARLQMVPYRAGHGTWAGMDCWGLVETWYREWIGVELADRADIAPGPDGINAGFNKITNWEHIPASENHCLAIMRSGRLESGHVGIVFDGGVIHTEERSGCVYLPLSSRLIAPRITCFLRYRPQ